MSKPTQRPWTLKRSSFEFSQDDCALPVAEIATVLYIEADGKRIFDIPMGDDYGLSGANAAHIVKCVNMHDKMIWLIAKIQTHGLNHFDDCKNVEYDDQECTCGMERIEKLIENALAKAKE